MIVGRKTKKIQQIYDNRSNQSIQYAIQKIKESPVAYYVDDLILFGSSARKEQKYGSDVDLLLQLSAGYDIQRNKADIIALKGEASPPCPDLPEVDLKIVAGDGWKNSRDLFYLNIRKDGVSVW